MVDFHSSEGPSGIEGSTSLERTNTPAVVSSRDSLHDENSRKCKNKSSSPSLVEGIFCDSGDNQGRDGIYDYYYLSEVQRAAFFERYSEEVARVPSEVLHFSSSLTDLAVERKARVFRLSEPYFLRAPGPMERVCFPREGEVGIYLDFFGGGSSLSFGRGSRHHTSAL